MIECGKELKVYYTIARVSYAGKSKVIYRTTDRDKWLDVREVCEGITGKLYFYQEVEQH